MKWKNSLSRRLAVVVPIACAYVPGRTIRLPHQFITVRACGEPLAVRASEFRL
ncbi:hypothetical protein ABIC46_002007 [Variovorax paradoxus]|jgi:hypothetical protein